MINSQRQSKNIRLTWPAALKTVVSLGLLALIFSKIPFASLITSLSSCQWHLLFISLIVVNLCMLVSVLKWRPLLTIHRIKLSFARLLAFYYVGLFANNFLPSSIGGDALRIYDVAKASGKIKEAAASVVMERLLAALALGLTAAAALVFVANIQGNVFIYRAVGAITAACVAMLAAVFCFHFKEESRVGQWLARLGAYKEHPRTLIRVLLLSFLFQFLLVLANVFIFQALGSNLPLAQHFLYIPVIMAVSMLPLSINGIGVREGMYVLLYGHAGLEQAVAVAGALLFFTLVTLSSLSGGVILALRR